MANPDENTPKVKQLKDFFTREIIRVAGYSAAESNVIVKKVHSLSRGLGSAQVAVEDATEEKKQSPEAKKKLTNPRGNDMVVRRKNEETDMVENKAQRILRGLKSAQVAVEDAKEKTKACLDQHKESMQHRGKTINPPSAKNHPLDLKTINIIFDLLQDLLKSRLFDFLIPEVCESFPNYTDELKKRKRDLNRNDLCIIVAGEANAGKSTLINRLVERTLFKPHVGESTTAFCRIHNSMIQNKHMSYSVLNKNNQTIKERSTLTDSEVNILNGLRSYMDKNTKFTSKDVDHVDINLYVPFLKENTMIVNTPGTGESLELSDKMMKYIPNAVAFIFVSSVTSLELFQRVRLVEILQEVLRLHVEKDIPCFDQTDAIFVMNKWDTVHPKDKDGTWTSVQHQLTKQWPVSNKTNIFRTALNSAMESEEEFKDEYGRLQRKILESVTKNQRNRQEQHERFLRNMLKTIEVAVKGRLLVASMSDVTRKKKMEDIEMQLINLRFTMKKKEDHLNHLISDTLVQLSQSLLQELNSEKIKYRILNPPGKHEMICVVFPKITDKIKERLCFYIIEWKSGEHVIAKLKFILERMKGHIMDMLIQIQRIKKDILGFQSTTLQEEVDSFELGFALFDGILSPAQKWIGTLSHAYSVCAIAGLMLPPGAVRNEKKRSIEEKKLIIDARYRDLVIQYDIAKIKRELEFTYGIHFRKLVERLFNETIEKQISVLMGTFARLKDENKCFQNWENELEQLLHKLNGIQNRI